MFSKIRKSKGKEDEDECQNEWDPVVTEATKQQQQQQQDPLTKSCTEENSEVPATVEIDLNDGEGRTDVPPSQLNWRQNLAKKLSTKSIGKKLKNPLAGGFGGGAHTVGKDNSMSTPNPAPPPPPSKKSYKLPGFFDFTPSAENVRLEYKFDEWNGQYLNPEYQDPPRVLTPFNHKVQSVGHKYWGEVFAAIQPVVDFAIALFLELLAFVARVTGRLITGTFLRLTDLLLKPLFVYTFNAILFPPFVLMANVLRAVVNCSYPLFDMAQRAMELAAIPLGAIRLVEIKHVHYVYNNQPQNAAAGPETKPPVVEDV